MRLGFIFSLPRAGSTYVQRVLSAAQGCATTAEPWLLPALMGIRYGNAPHAEFAYDHVRAGLGDALARLEQPEEAWRGALRAMAESFYGNFAESGDIFLDKTPRNAAFAGEIAATFPEAKLMFLWRNPLAVVHSINQTWGGGKWKAYFYEYDLKVGLQAMVEAYDRLRDDPRVLAMRYEDLVEDPERHWPRVFAHFGLPYDSAHLAAPPKIDSRMGDRTGQAKYAGTSSASVGSWVQGFGSPLRQRWARSYVAELGEGRLATMGYSLSELEAQLVSAPHGFAASDLLRMPLAGLYHRLDPYVWREKCQDGKARRFSRR